MNLSDNLLGEKGIRALTNILAQNTSLKTLNLSRMGKVRNKIPTNRRYYK
ncbi:MAG: hypothetical protein AB8U20_07365 [Rickettsiales endosymbiont of Dermacentor nuttalli]